MILTRNLVTSNVSIEKIKHGGKIYVPESSTG